jgi:hypothetical protein
MCATSEERSETYPKVRRTSTTAGSAQMMSFWTFSQRDLEEESALIGNFQ